jgi:ABC-2 type transport system permease protein
MRAIRLMRAVSLAQYKESSAFRSQMAITILTGPVFFLIQFFIWSAVFSVRDTVNGMTLEQILLYYGVIAMIGFLTYDNADWDVQDLVHSGRLVTFLLRPISYRHYAMSIKIGHRMLAFWVEIIPVFLIFYFLFGIKMIPYQFGWFLVSITLSFFMVFLVNFCIGMSAFWLMRAQGVRRMFLLLKDVSAGVFIPLSFFPEVLQKVLFFMPFQYIAYVPSQVFKGSYELAGYTFAIPVIVGLQAVAVLIMWGVSEWIWRLGLNKFTGVGT